MILMICSVHFKTVLLNLYLRWVFVCIASFAEWRDWDGVVYVWQVLRAVS